MPVDPIINLGLPVVQSYLAGMAARRQQEEQALRQQQFAYGIQQDQQAQARDARDFGYRQQRDAQQQANADRAFGLNERQFGLSQQRFGLDQSQNDRQTMAFDQANQREQAAQAAYGSQFPQIVQARGLSPDQLWEQAGSLAQQETAFRAAPSGVQQTLLRPAMDTVRDQQVAAAAQAKAWQNYQRAADQIINDPALGPEQRDDLIRQLREEFFQRMGIVGKHFGQVTETPAQISARLGQFGLSPDQIGAALPAVGLHQAGIGQEMAQNILGTRPKNPYTAGLRAQDAQLDAEIRKTRAMIDHGEKTKMDPALLAQLQSQLMQKMSAQVGIAQQLTQLLNNGGNGQQPQGSGNGSGVPDEAIDQAIQALAQRLGRAPTDEEVLQALQGTP